MANKPLVIDTNVLLDCFVFAEPTVLELGKKITTGEVSWITTDAMEAEYLRVLGYPNIVRRLALLSVAEQEGVTHIFQAYAHKCETPTQADTPQCKDKDDQIYIDLAIAHQAILLSKDLEVLKLNGKKELLAMHPAQFSSKEKHKV